MKKLLRSWILVTLFAVVAVCAATAENRKIVVKDGYKLTAVDEAQMRLVVGIKVRLAEAIDSKSIFANNRYSVKMRLTEKNQLEVVETEGPSGGEFGELLRKIVATTVIPQKDVTTFRNGGRDAFNFTLIIKE